DQAEDDADGQQCADAQSDGTHQPGDFAFDDMVRVRRGISIGMRWIVVCRSHEMCRGGKGFNRPVAVHLSTCMLNAFRCCSTLRSASGACSSVRPATRLAMTSPIMKAGLMVGKNDGLAVVVMIFACAIFANGATAASVIAT